MKNFASISLTMLTAITLAISGCKEQVKIESTTTTAQREAIPADKTTVDQGPVDIDMNAVPTPVQTSFTTKNAKAEKVSWKRYTATADEDDDRLIPNNDYYYVVYYNEGADYRTWYDTTGTIVKTSMKVAGPKELPAAVNKVINEQFPGYTVSEIDKENDKNIDVYELELNKGEQKSKIKITPDGNIVKRKDK